MKTQLLFFVFGDLDHNELPSCPSDVEMPEDEAVMWKILDMKDRLGVCRSRRVRPSMKLSSSEKRWWVL